MEVSSMRSRILTGAIKSAIVGNRLLLVLPAILLVLHSSFPSRVQDMNEPSSSQASIDKQCIANLKSIYQMIKIHLHHSAGVLGFPSNLELIYSLTKEPNLFICPADKQINPSVKTDTFRTSYEVVNDPLKPKLSTTPAARIAIVAEKRSNHNDQRFVLFYDGSVRAFDKAQFEKLKNNGFIDIRPLDTHD
jgi:hypothetical protein